MCPTKRVVHRRIIRDQSEPRVDPPSHQDPPIPPSPSSSIILARSCAGKAVSTGRRIDFNFLRNEGFSIGEKIQSLGWGYLCSLDLPTYPDLVRDFYSTLKKGSNGFHCLVRGREIHVTEALLGDILRMPREGQAPTSHGQRASALRAILGRDEVNPLEEVSANQLTVEMRLLHHIIGRIFFPKIGRFDFVSERDLVFMYCIIEEIPLNLPCMMISCMEEATIRSRNSLPYGMVLTLLFREFGVMIPDAEPKKNLRATDVYNGASLHRMGYRKVQGQWQRRGGEPQRADEGEPSRAQEEQHRSPSPLAPSPGPSSSVPPTPVQPAAPQFGSSPIRLDTQQLRTLAGMVADELVARDSGHGQSEQLRRISDDMRALSEHVSSLEGSSSERFSQLQSSLERIFMRLEQHPVVPPAQDDRDFSFSPSAPAPPPQPAASVAQSRPPRPPSQPAGPASRTRSHFRARSTSSTPSVHQPPTLSRVYTRRSQTAPSHPVEVPSDED